MADILMAFNDPGHSHTYQLTRSNTRNAGGVASQALSDNYQTTEWASGSGTGISIQSSNTWISIQNLGGSEVRVKNVAMLACIKF